MTTGKKIVCTFSAAMVPMLLFAFASGPDPRYTAAPGDSPLACASAGCHTGLAKGGPINAAGGAVTATFSSGTTYAPGQPVTITVNVTDPANTLHGFQMTARLESNLATDQAGRFSYTSTAGVFVLCDFPANVPRSPSGSCPAGSPVEFIEHNAPRTGTWTFTWTPPPTNQGPVHFYIAGNAVNGDGTNGPQDHVYTASYVLQPAAPCTLSPPVITSVQSAGGFGKLNVFAPGSWLEIFGSNLAGSQTREWTAADFSGPNGSIAPIGLDGFSASVNGKPAFIWYLFKPPTGDPRPTQMNVQAPADSTTGPVAITVTNCAGTSGPVMIQESTVAPGMLAPAADASPFFTFNGKQYLVAQFQGESNYVGSPTLSSALRPAKPHDVLWSFGIGFGGVGDGATVPGVVADAPHKTNASVSIAFGNTPASVTYAGLYPSYVGLYLFIYEVPDVPDGDYQINMTVGGQPLQQPPFFLTVHR